MEIDHKVLEAALKAGGNPFRLREAIEAAFAAADLVSRSELDRALLEAEELKGALAKLEHVAGQEMQGFRSLEALAKTRGAQIAALRKVCVRALQDVRSGYVLKATESIKAALAAAPNPEVGEPEDAQ